MSLARRLAGTAAGLVASRFVPALPDELHPVARFGQAMTAVEQHVWRDDRAAGAAYATAGAAIGAATGRAARSTAVAVAMCAAGGQLRATAARIADLLDAGDLDGARAVLPALVGRDPSGLDPSGVAAAAVESVAENMVDAVFAPAFWAVLGGAAGAGAHRAVNTMDAMVGRRDERYAAFGWAAARLDDAAAWAPARLFVVAVLAACPDRRDDVRRAVRSDAPAHPSPNAGVAEAAMAGALGCELGGPLHYRGVLDDRPRLGAGPRPRPADLRRAIALAERAETMLVAVLAAAALVRGARR